MHCSSCFFAKGNSTYFFEAKEAYVQLVRGKAVARDSSNFTWVGRTAPSLPACQSARRRSLMLVFLCHYSRFQVDKITDVGWSRPVSWKYRVLKQDTLMLPHGTLLLLRVCFRAGSKVVLVVFWKHSRPQNRPLKRETSSKNLRFPFIFSLRPF